MKPKRLTRPGQPEREIDLLRHNKKGKPFGSSGLFTRVARGEYAKAGRAGAFTSRELALGRGSSRTINESAAGPLPTTSTGPALRRSKTGHTRG